MILATVRATANEGKRAQLQQTLVAVCQKTRNYFAHDVYEDASDEKVLLLISKWTGSSSNRPGDWASDKILGELMGISTKLCRRLDVEIHTVSRTTRNRKATASASDVASNGPFAPAEKVVRAAESYIRTHLADDLTAAELAAVAGVSPRTLFRSFRRLGRRSPMKVLETARLKQARQSLLEGREEHTVTRIATDSGFVHLGRFSAIYKGKYRESPSETLRGSKQRRRTADQNGSPSLDDSRVRSDWRDRFLPISDAVRRRHEPSLGSAEYA